MKICLTDKLAVVAFPPLPMALICFLGQPRGVGPVPYTRRRWRSGSRGTAWCPSLGICCRHHQTRSAGLKERKAGAVVPVLQLSSWLQAPAPASDVPSHPERQRHYPKLLCHRVQNCSSPRDSTPPPCHSSQSLCQSLSAA